MGLEKAVVQGDVCIHVHTVCEPRYASAGAFVDGEIPVDVGVWEGFLEEETSVTLERCMNSKDREGGGGGHL